MAQNYSTQIPLKITLTIYTLSVIAFCLSTISLKIKCKQSTNDNPSRQHKACVSRSLELYQCENKIMGVMFSICSNIIITQVGGKLN